MQASSATNHILGKNVILHLYILTSNVLPFFLDKLDHVLDDSANTRRMVNQLLCSSFKRHQVPGEGLLPAGPKVQKIISYMHFL